MANPPGEDDEDLRLRWIKNEEYDVPGFEID